MISLGIPERDSRRTVARGERKKSYVSGSAPVRADDIAIMMLFLLSADLIDKLRTIGSPAEFMASDSQSNPGRDNPPLPCRERDYRKIKENLLRTGLFESDRARVGHMKI